MNIPEIRHKAISEPQKTIARLENEVAGALQKAEAAKAHAEAVHKEDVARGAEAHEQNRPVPAAKADAAEKAAKETKLEWERLKLALANTEAKLHRAREANKEQLIAGERKELQSVTREMLKALDGVTDATGKMREIKRRIIWLNTGRSGVPEQKVPAIPNEGGEDRVDVERLIEALKAFARDPEPRRPSGPQKLVGFEPGTVVVHEPLMETLT